MTWVRKLNCNLVKMAHIQCLLQENAVIQYQRMQSRSEAQNRFLYSWDASFIRLKTCTFLHRERHRGLVVALSVTSSTVLEERTIHLLSDMPSSQSCAKSGHFSSVKKGNDAEEKSSVTADLSCPTQPACDKHFIMVQSYDLPAVSYVQPFHCMQTEIFTL